MKTPIVIISALLLTTACKETTKEKDGDAVTASASRDTAKAAGGAEGNQSVSTTKPFDISTVPVSDKELGQFPYFGVPENMVYQEEQNKKFHRSYLGVNGKLVPVEGRTFAAYVFAKSRSSSEFEPLAFENNYDNLIKSVGGILVSNQKIEPEEIERVGKDELFKYHSVADIYNEAVKTYAIRRVDGEIWVQLSFHNAAGNIIVVQKGEMKPTAAIIPATEIKKQLDAAGKAVLYIQFDTDKATLKPEGEKAVTEIAKVLSADKNLKIAINGHTDNSGTEARNLQLSKERAASVMNAVASAGVDKSRLSAEGFGANNPLADNATDDGKAKNRRVELVKK